MCEPQKEKKPKRDKKSKKDKTEGGPVITASDKEESRKKMAGDVEAARAEAQRIHLADQHQAMWRPITSMAFALWQEALATGFTEPQAWEFVSCWWDHMQESWNRDSLA